MSNDVMTKLLKILLSLSIHINSTSASMNSQEMSGNMAQKVAKQAINCLGNLYNRTEEAA
jgi:hypothetical protein